MSGPIHHILPVLIQVSLAQDRIIGSRNKGTFRAVTHKDYFTMPISGTAFGTHQIVASILLIDMRSFNPDRFLGQIHTTIHNNLIRTGNHLIVFHIILPDFNHTVSVIEFFTTLRSVIMNHIRLAVIIKEDRGVDTVKIQLDRITPSFERIFRLYNDIPESPRKLGGDHIESIIIGVILDGRSIHAGTDTCIMYFQL